MVWALIFSLLLLLPTPAVAEPARTSYTVYQSLAPNSAYIDWASTYVPKMAWGDNYVFFRSGQYQYCLAFGDLSWSGGVFGGDSVQCVFLNLSSGGYGDSSVTSLSGSFSLNPSDKVVYSNLGDFPSLAPEYFYQTAILYCLVVGLICSVLRSIWSFLLRMGVYVHSAA